MGKLTVKITAEGKVVSQNSATRVLADKPSLVVLQAKSGQQFEILDAQTDKAPRKVFARRIGKDLHISLSNCDEPDVIIGDFFSPAVSNVALVGEQSVRYTFEDPSLTDFPADSCDVGMVIAGATTPSGAAVGVLAPLAFSPLGVLAGVGLAAAAGSGGSGGSSGSTPDTTPPSSATGALNAASDTGVAGDGKTSNSKPAVSGVTEPGAKVEVTINGKVYTATADASGKYQVSVVDTLADGTYPVSIKATDGSGNSATFAGTPIVIDTVTNVAITNPGKSVTNNVISGTAEAGATITVTGPDNKVIGSTTAGADGKWAITPASAVPPGDVTALAVDAAGNSNSGAQSNITSIGAPTVTLPADKNADGFINKEESSSTYAVNIGLPVEAKVGNVLTVTNGSDVRPITLTAADISAGKIVATYNLPLDGPIKVDAYLTAGQIKSATGSVSAVFDTSDLALGSKVEITTDASNDGFITGLELNGANTLGVKFTLPGSAKAGDKLVITPSSGSPLNVTLSAADILAGAYVGSLPVPNDGAKLTVLGVITDAAGNTATLSDSATMRTAVAGAPTVELRGDLNNDTLMSRSEAGTSYVARITLPTGAAVNDTLTVTNASDVKTITLTQTDITAGYRDVSYVTPADGASVKVVAKLTNASQVAGPEAFDTAVFDLSELSGMTVVITTDANDNAVVTTGELNGGPISVKIGLPVGAAIGDKVLVTTTGSPETVTLVAADIAAKYVTRTFEAPVDGQVFKVSASMSDAAGNASTAPDPSDSATIKTTAAGAPTVEILDDKNLDGWVTSSESSASSFTAQIKFTGAVAGDVLNISVDGVPMSPHSITAIEASTGAFQVTVPKPAAGVKTTVTAAITNSSNVPGPSGSAFATADGPSTIAGTIAGSVLEDATPNTATGQLTISDVNPSDLAFVAPSVMTGIYGAFTLDSSGKWTYALDNTKAVVQALTPSDTVTDSIVVSSKDGTTNQKITVSITGVNDAAVITGQVDGSVASTGVGSTAQGTIAVTDVDKNQASFATPAPADLVGQYGTFTFEPATGKWTYAADPAKTAALSADAKVEEKLVIKSFDGTPQTITVTVSGANDTAVITGQVTGTVTEDSATQNVTSGKINIADPDPGQSAVQIPSVLDGTYGKFTMAGDGSWTYTLDNTKAATQALAAGENVVDSLVVKSVDETATTTINVTVTGVNDAASITGDITKTVADNGTAVSASGTVVVSDADTGQTGFVAPTPASLIGQYGTFTFEPATGKWTYETDPVKAAPLGKNDSPMDTLVVKSLDGTSQTISVTVQGRDDVAVIAGDKVGSATEDGAASTVTGKLTVTDIDTGESGVKAQTATVGTYGSFSVDAAGAWSYALDNTKAATQALKKDEIKTDIFTVLSADGNTNQTVTISVKGVNDTAQIAGSSSGSVEDNVSSKSASGKLDVTDLDAGEAGVVPQTNYSGTYGSFNIAADGTWSYLLDSSKAATQALGDGQSANETITVTSTDGGSTKDIVIKVTGASDAAVITGTTTGVATEDSVALNKTGGTLVATDPDSGESEFQVPTSLAGTYGAFTLTAQGVWTYTLDNSKAATQALVANATGTDKLTVLSKDASASTEIVVTVTGANDTATITGTNTGGVTEDSSVAASGSLALSDVDAGQATFTLVTPLIGTYGAFTFDKATGAWDYKLDNTKTSVQGLTEGQKVTDKLTIRSADGTAQNEIVVTITGKDDVAVISGTNSGALTEDAVTSVINASLSITDADVNESSFQTPTPAQMQGVYGVFGFNTGTGSWSYSLNNTSGSATQALTKDEKRTDVLTVVSQDGKTSQDITVTVTGANDVATITGPATGAVTENSAALNAASGTLVVADVDTGEAGFQTPSSLAGTYGTYTFSATTGAWTYVLDNTNPATQALAANQQVTDTLTVKSLDGTATQDITVTVTGANGSAVITGTKTGAVTEDSAILNTASGTLAITDSDAGEAVFQTPASLEGIYGAYTFNAATGAWTYALDNARPATQALVANATATDKLTVLSKDGSVSTEIVVTVTGTNDAATITGTKTGAVTEDSATLTVASGTLAVSDLDASEVAYQTPENLAGAYGNFTFNPATGAWTYALDNTKPATQALTADQQVTETLTVKSADGTATQDITVTVTGVNDVAVITGDTGKTVVDDGTSVSASGTLVVADLDAGQAGFTTPAAASLIGQYGTFTFNAATGGWNYATDPVKAAALGKDDSVIESLVVNSIDGTPQTISVTVKGRDDLAVITGDKTGSATEDDAVSTATGKLTAVDPDSGESSVRAQTATAGVYGAFSVDATGAWSYTLDSSKAATQALKKDETKNEIFTVFSADGNTSQTVTVSIKGVNDPAQITGLSTGAVEDAASKKTASGKLDVVDVDAGEASVVAQTSFSGTYGTFNIAADGAWTYVLDSSKPATQSLGAGQTSNETITVTSTDGAASEDIVIEITGVNNVAVISGAITGAVTEDSVALDMTGGALINNDPDAGEASFEVPSNLEGTYGTFTMTTDGVWTYALDNTRATTQALIASQQVTDTLTVKSLDGTATQDIKVTVTGANDLATITGAKTGDVIEDAVIAASGTLVVSDVDAGQATFLVLTSLIGTYGTFTFDTSTGAWDYNLDNTQNFVQRLIDGQKVTDQLTIRSADGTAQQDIVVTITGKNDVAVISGTNSGALTEDATTSVINASLSITDADVNESSFQTPTPAQMQGVYGLFGFNTGTGSWSYSLNNTSGSATQKLAKDEIKTDILQVVSKDGLTSQDITVTVTGVNDAASFAATSTAAGAVTEDTTLTATGVLTVIDVDNGDNAVIAQTDVIGTYGKFSVTEAGDWTYTLDNGSAAVQALNTGEKKTETFTVKSKDGTASKDVAITINGLDDNKAPVAVEDAITAKEAGGLNNATLGIDPTGNVLTNDTDENAGDTKTVSSVGLGATADLPVTQGTTSANGTTVDGMYGSLILGGDGTYKYMVNNNNETVQALATSADTLTETFTYSMKDAAGQTSTSTLTVTVEGANDVAVINYSIVVAAVPLASIGTAAADGFVINGAGSFNYSGVSVSEAGDVNGDGLADVIVGAYGAHFYVGKSYVVFGKTEATAVELSAIASGNGGFVINGANSGDYSGFIVSNAGDVNGDGLADLILGGTRSTKTDGKSYVVFGKTETTAVDLSAIAAGNGGFIINGVGSDDKNSYSVSEAGDVNGDGLADLILGANGDSSYAGKGYVVFGKTGTSAVELSAIAAGNGGFIINGESNIGLRSLDVSDAGDLNGDGLADLILGASRLNNATGKSYVVFGKTDTTAIDLSAIAAGNGGFSINGSGTSISSGNAVSNAGDVNGDGINDLIIGAYTANNSAGRAYVVFGKTETTAVNLSAIDSGNGGFVINGEISGDLTGFSVSDAGDVNGDGLADLIVGAVHADNLAGKSYVVFGKTDTTAVNLSAIASGNGGFVINGASSGDRSGRTVSNAGDVNGDGINDLIVGASYANNSAGKSYVIYGGSYLNLVGSGNLLNDGAVRGFLSEDEILTATGTLVVTDVDNGQNKVVAQTNVAGTYGKFSVTEAGDWTYTLDNDSAAVQALNADEKKSETFTVKSKDGTAAQDIVVTINGQSDQILMAAVPLASIGSEAADGFVINGAGTGDSSGSTVSNAGDVNGDGLDDLIIASPNNSSFRDAVYVVFGKTTQTPIDLSSVASGVGGFVINKNYSGRVGSFTSVSAAGDTNGDGLDDLILNTENGTRGHVFVIFGKTNGAPVQLYDVAINADFELSGYLLVEVSGVTSSVSEAGDVNGDGYEDVIIGTKSGNSGAGVSHIVFGRPTNTSSEILGMTTKGFTINGVNAGDESGFSVSSAGDVNGDGLGDIVVGAPNSSQTGPGKSYVVFGKTDQTAINLADVEAGNGGFAILGSGSTDISGFSVSSAGDVNGDGFGDVIVGNPNAGKSYLLFGGVSTNAVNLSGLAAGGQGFVINGQIGGGYPSGWSVSRAGDVNGDGFSDLIVNGPSAGGVDSSYVVFGGVSMADVNLADIETGAGGFIINSASGAYSGSSVSAAGDVNGDGFSDLVVGDSSAGNGGTSYVIFGGAFLNLKGGGNILTDAITGTTGNDTLTGTTGADVIVGNTGNDVITPNGGADVVYAGPGDDTLKVNASDVSSLVSGTSHFDGGNGIDVFSLIGADITLDLTNISTHLSSFEHIDLTGSGDNKLVISTADVLSLGDFNIFNDANSSFSGPQNHKQFMVTGDAGDSVQLTDMTNWFDAGETVTHNSHSYNVWGNQNMQLLVDQNLAFIA